MSPRTFPPPAWTESVILFDGPGAPAFGRFGFAIPKPFLIPSTRIRFGIQYSLLGIRVKSVLFDLGTDSALEYDSNVAIHHTERPG